MSILGVTVSIRCLELWESRDQRPDGTTLRHAIVGTNDEDAAKAAYIAAAPSTLGSWVRKPGPRLTREGHRLFTGEFEYGPTSIVDRTPFPGQGGVSPPPPPPPPPAGTDQVTDEFSFNITGQTRRIYQSESTRARIIRPPFASGTAPDFRKAIGVSKKSIEGCDRLESKLEFSITKQFEFVTFAYIDALADLVGTINSNDMSPLGAAEELLLLGVSGKGGGQSAEKNKPSLTFNFAKSKNRTNVPITTDSFGNNEIVAPVVKGWDYVWCYYLDEPGSTTIFTQRALAAYIEQIYPKKNFINLGLYS